MEAFVALADPVRVGIVEILARRGELSAGEIGENFAGGGAGLLGGTGLDLLGGLVVI